jgi:pimeloyl-ACP methyl ester carboxylesterase
MLWGELDHGVPPGDHAELALGCGGVLVPIAGAGHAPFLDSQVDSRRGVTSRG